MANAEQVVIDILANDNASGVLNNIRTILEDIRSSAGNAGASFHNVNENVSDAANNTNRAADNARLFGESSEKALKLGQSNFHELNNMMVTVGSQFTNLSNQIASVFGAAGLGGMIEKMWKGAAERQTNMLFLIRQRGVSQANEYYDEIMDIVTQLPGDDTFLTNILNTASALDKSIKLDNLKEMGKTITDFTIASTMKGEKPFESQRDTRLYLNSGDTKSLRNSIISDELDLLENRNSILERTQALQEALNKKGLSGLSEYESATNALEEFKGHFQKAFTDIGAILISIIQPLLKFYNSLDAIFGSRISQGIILLAIGFIGLFSAIGLGMIIIPTLIRNFEILGMVFKSISVQMELLNEGYSFHESLLIQMIGLKNAEVIVQEGGIKAGARKLAISLKEAYATALHIPLEERRTIGLWGLTTATLSHIKTELLNISTKIKHILIGHEELVVESARVVVQGEIWVGNLTEAQTQQLETIALNKSVKSKIIDTIQTQKRNIVTWAGVSASEAETMSIYGLTSAIFTKISAKITDIALVVSSILFGYNEAEVIAAKMLLEEQSGAVTVTATQRQAAENIVRREGIRSRITERIQIVYNTLAKWAGVSASEAETMGIFGTTSAILSNISSRIMHILLIAREIIFGLTSASTSALEAYEKGHLIGVELTEAQVSQLQQKQKIREIHSRLASLFSLNMETNGIWKNIIAGLRKIWSTGLEILNTIKLTVVTIISAIVKSRNAETSFAEALAEAVDANMKNTNTTATLGLASATAILESELAPLILPILIIVGAIAALIVVVEKLGEAFGWWSDFGSMIDAISSGINSLWSAFINSEPIQGIIAYFQKFVESIQYVWESISVLFNLLFGGGDTESFDIVQSIIDLFGSLGEIIKWVWDIIDDFMSSDLGIIFTTIITALNPLIGVFLILVFYLDEIGSLFEDIGDAINRFTGTEEFQELSDAFAEVWDALQEPFQEIFELFSEIGEMFGEIFGSGDPEGRGTEDRINFLVEILKGLAFIIRSVVIPVIQRIALVIKILLLPIRAVLEVIKFIGSAIQWVTGLLGVFTSAWEFLTNPLNLVYSIFEGIGNMINTVSDAIKNSIIGKLLGWDKDSNDENKKDDAVDSTKNNLYDTMKNTVSASDMDFVTKHQILGELDKQSLTNNNINNVRNLGRTYNNNNNQRQVIVNQNFSEGSVQADARNMTAKDVRKMFVGAFGYNRSVGRNGVLR